MVLESNENVHSRCSSPATRTSPSQFGRSRAGDSSSAQHTEPPSLPAAREKLADMGLQKDTINVILASWRNSTSKQYNSYLLGWKAFCDQKQIIPSENARVREGLAFLTHLHNQNLGYSAINTARSALSSILTLQDHRTFGEHPLVTRFLKGIFELKPSLPRYSLVWDVGVVLRYFHSTDYPQAMNLVGLTKKLTSLLITAQRCETLVKLDIDNMQELPDRIVFHIRDKLKTTRLGKHIAPIEFLPYPADGKLCSVAHIREYISHIQSLRQHQQLLVSYQKPHKAVSNATIGRWVKTTLANAGIDMGTFSAHSSCSASTTCGLLAGIPLKDVLKAGGWSTATTFARHYNKPVDTNFGQALLNQFENN